MDGFVSNNKLPQTLIIYIKTNIPKYGYITYLPKMSNPHTSEHSVSFTTQLKLTKECIHEFKLQKDKNTEQDKDDFIFFHSSEFNNLVRFCATKNKAVQSDFDKSLKYYTNQGNISNNIQLIINELFKKDNVLYLDSKPYIIYASTVNANAWQLDTKPLHLIPHNLISTADREYDTLAVECPDCISGINADTLPINKERTHHGVKMTAYTKLMELDISPKFAVCDLRTFFYITDTSIGFTSTLLSKYVDSFQSLMDACATKTTSYNLIVSRYKSVFYSIIEILNVFIEKISVIVKSDAAESIQLLKNCAQLDMSIYKTFTDLNFGEIMNVLIKIPSSISSMNRENIDVRNREKTLLAIQSFFAFRKCIMTNAQLVKTTDAFNYVLEQKLSYEYCRLLENVYYFQKQFIHIYLFPLLQDFNQTKHVVCAENDQENSEEYNQCVQNMSSKKITTMIAQLFIQSARQNYLEDYCNAVHKQSTLEKKCTKILKVFSKDVLDTKRKEEIEQLFTDMTYISEMQFNNQILYVFNPNKKYQTIVSINKALQILMKLYMRLHNLICDGSSDWKLNTRRYAQNEFDGLSAYIKHLSDVNGINIIVLNRDAHIILKTNAESRHDGYFILVQYMDKDGNDYYCPAFSQSQILFNHVDEGKKDVIIGGAKKKNAQYVLPSLRIREKASLDDKQKIYKPALLAYYIEISLELFPSKLNEPKNHDQKNTFICNKRKMAIKDSFESVKQTLKSITTFGSNLVSQGLAETMYFIPSTTYVLESRRPIEDENRSDSDTLTKDDVRPTIKVIGDESIHHLIKDIHNILPGISTTINKLNVLQSK